MFSHDVKTQGVDEKRPSHLDVFLLFLKIGCLGFGGPYALLTYLEKEIVEKKKWLASEVFWEGVAIGQLTPGPIYFATAVFCGYRLLGSFGAMNAALASILPAFILTLILGYFYLYIQHLPGLQITITLLLAVVAGLLISIVWKDRNKFFKTKIQRLIGFLILIILVFFHVNAILVLVSAAILGAFFLGPEKST